MRIAILILAFVGLLALAPAIRNYVQEQWVAEKVKEAEVERVTFKTADGVEIVGELYVPEEIRHDPYATLLLHMMPATKESWREYALRAREDNCVVLAIDLRGHGESTKKNGEVLNFQEFTDEQHQQSIQDIEAAAQFLEERGFPLEVIGGASIGANLALSYAADHPEIKKIFLLSPGFNYRGIEAQPLVEKLKETQGIYAVGGSQDVRSSGDDAGTMAQTLHDKAPVIDKKFEIIRTETHGTDIFKQDPKLIDRILEWVETPGTEAPHVQ